jgi:hypothetical protein
MARSNTIKFEHAGVVRFTRGFNSVRNFSATQVVLGALAVIGSPVTGAAGKLRTGLASWNLARKQRAEDEKLWNVALSDARVMADLSRAMSRDAARDVRGYY